MELKFLLDVTEALPAGVKVQVCSAGLLGRSTLSQSWSINCGHLCSPSKRDLADPLCGAAAVREGLGRDAESDALPWKPAANKLTQPSMIKHTHKRLHNIHLTTLRLLKINTAYNLFPKH